MVPRVTTNGFRPTRATSTPLSAPSSRPTIKNVGIEKPANCADKDISMPATAETASTEPTDKSMPLVKMTKVMPEASTMLMDTWRKMFMVLLLVMNVDVPSAEKYTVRPYMARYSTTSTGSMPRRRIRFEALKGSPARAAPRVVVVVMLNLLNDYFYAASS